MKDLDNILDQFEKLVNDDLAYKVDAYSFVMEALHHTVSEIKKPGHITGKELLEGIRTYAIKQYGPMSKTVLNYWGIHETIDFGKIVFALVEVGMLRKQPEDRLSDFEDIYNFDKVFTEGYQIKDED